MNHSVRRLTTGMKNQLKEVANKGGSWLIRALASANIRLFNNIYRIDIHNNWMINPHVKLLKTILANADIIQLSNDSYQNNQELRWSNIKDFIYDDVEFIDNQTMTNSDNSAQTNIKDKLGDDVILPGAIVLSITFYKLAKSLGYAPIAKNYQMIIDRLFEIYNHLMIVSKIEDGSVIESEPMRYLQDFKLLYNPSLVKKYSIKKY